MRTLADAATIDRWISELARLIAEDAQGRPFALVGLRSLGDEIARRLATRLHPLHVGTLDITLYRDDLATRGAARRLRPSELDFPLDGLHVVLVDDVVMTGRSTRAALQVLTDLGRPGRVRLAALIDRGGRELPIQPDYVAVDLSQDLAPGEWVEVELQPEHTRDAVTIRD